MEATNGEKTLTQNKPKNVALKVNEKRGTPSQNPPFCANRDQNVWKTNRKAPQWGPKAQSPDRRAPPPNQTKGAQTTLGKKNEQNWGLHKRSPQTNPSSRTRKGHNGAQWETKMRPPVNLTEKGTLQGKKRPLIDTPITGHLRSGPTNVGNLTRLNVKIWENPNWH